MATAKSPQTLQRSIQDLFFNYDPEARGLAAATLERNCMGVAEEREALEALDTALHDPSLRVQDIVLQSLVRLSTK